MSINKYKIVSIKLIIIIQYLLAYDLWYLSTEILFLKSVLSQITFFHGTHKQKNNSKWLTIKDSVEAFLDSE